MQDARDGNAPLVAAHETEILARRNGEGGDAPARCCCARDANARFFRDDKSKMYEMENPLVAAC